MNILFVRPPRLTWSHVDEDSNNILPLAYPCLAAQVRRDLPKIKMEILDCNIEKLGWRRLEQYIKDNRYDVLALGSETVYVDADKRVLRWSKQYHPEAVRIVGGRHYPFNMRDAFDDDLAHFIVRGEGEITFVRLLEQLQSPAPKYEGVQGLIWRDSNGAIRDEGWRPLAQNLDDFPLPAYDLTPVEKYARHSAFWTNGITIEHGRGCEMGCKFCTFWPQMARWNPQPYGEWAPQPYYRTKSVERTVEEVDWLINGYKKGLLFFVDGTFEHDVDWTNRFFDEILRRGDKFVFWTFSRADTLLKCEEQGVLEKGVRAGWRHILIGAEHSERMALDYLRKPGENADRVLKLVRLLTKKYPEVISHVTFMGGVPEDNKTTLKRLYKYAVNLKCDIASMHFLTPMPGTELYEEAKREGLLKVFDHTKYNWFTPVMATRYMSIEDLDRFWAPKILSVNFHHPLHKIKRMFTGDPENRRVMRIGFLMFFRYILSYLLMFFRKPGAKFRSFITPAWYDS